MKYLKILALAAIAVCALMAFASSASATAITVTTENGTTDTVTKGAKLSAELEAGTEAILKSSFVGEVKCSASTVAGEIENAGGAEATVSGPNTSLTFSSCNASVAVLKPGSLELHTELTGTNNGNGTLTSSGSEVTVELAGIHCIFSTNNTDIGTVTGTHTGHVIIHAKATIPRTGGRSGAFCGSSAEWRATYTVIHLTWNNETFTNFTIH